MYYQLIVFNSMLSSYEIILYISIVTTVWALTQPTVQLENSSFIDESVDHSSSNCNRKNGIFLSTYSTRGRRKKMEDFFVSSQDCCFAGILHNDAILQVPKSFIIEFSKEFHAIFMSYVFTQLLHLLRCTSLVACTHDYLILSKIRLQHVRSNGACCSDILLLY